MILRRIGKTEKAQTMPFFVLIIAVLILAIPATMIIGEVAFQRVRLSNVADSAVISAGSALCRSLNQIHKIHKGPGGMMLTSLGLQAFLMSRVWPFKGAPLATGFFINSMLASRNLYREATRIADQATKDLRQDLYNSAFGGGLIDEPKPFLAREVLSDGKLDYDSYLERDSRFTVNFRDFKRAHPDGANAWYMYNALSYSFNKSKDAVLNDLNSDGTPKVGVQTFRSTGPVAGYEEYLLVNLNSVPTGISVSPQRGIMIYLYFKPEIPTPVPGFIPHPYTWIRRINISGGNAFSLQMQKMADYTRIPFFGTNRRPILNHTSTVRVQGSVGSGYTLRME